VQGEFIFAATHGGITSADALKYPTDSEVSLAKGFLAVDQPWMRGVFTDTHFFQRDRMGRLVAFLARVEAAGWARGDNQTGGRPGVLGVGISEHTAVLVDGGEGGDGSATLVGVGPVYFLTTSGHSPTTCIEGKPLSWDRPGVHVWRWNSSMGDSGGGSGGGDGGGGGENGGGGGESKVGEGAEVGAMKGGESSKDSGGDAVSHLRSATKWSFGSWSWLPADEGKATDYDDRDEGGGPGTIASNGFIANYSLTVHKGKLESSQPGGGIY
jgi:hypothetical protein